MRENFRGEEKETDDTRASCVRGEKEAKCNGKEIIRGNAIDYRERGEDTGKVERGGKESYGGERGERYDHRNAFAVY